jgi:prefoldin subunit 5
VAFTKVLERLKKDKENLEKQLQEEDEDVELLKQSLDDIDKELETKLKEVQAEKITF